MATKVFCKDCECFEPTPEEVNTDGWCHCWPPTAGEHSVRYGTNPRVKATQYCFQGIAKKN